MIYGAALWPVLREFLILIGGWLVRRGIAHGARALASYLYLRAEHFGEEVGLATSAKKAEVYKARAKRYLRCSDWLRLNARRLGRRVWSSFETLSDRTIPDRSPWERKAA